MKSGSHIPKIYFICFNERPLKLTKNAFYLKSSFRSQGIQIFVLNFVSKNSLNRKIRFISKFMTSQSVYQTITIHILPNISQSKGN